MLKTFRPIFLLSLLAGTLFSPRIYAAGKELILIWEYDRTSQPAPDQFVITYASSADQGNVLHQFQLPNQGPSSCAGVKGVDITPDTGCGRPPDCLPPGMLVVWIQADVGGTLSEKSNIANCLVLPGCQYECTARSVPPEIQKMADNPPADLTTLQAVLQQIPPAPAIPITPPPTFTPPPLTLPPTEPAVPG